MKNNYGLPKKSLEVIFKRDEFCVYCHKNMNKIGDRRDWPTIEHLNYLPPWNNPETVVICCWSCNSSRGNKPITKWFESRYCLEREINIDSVSIEVKNYISSHPFK
jgi:hypothetical protein